MRLVSWIILWCGFIFSVQALTCRSDGGPKEEQLKTIYMNCLKSQDGRNSSYNREYSNNRGQHSSNRDRDSDSSSREKRRQTKGSQWDRRSDAFGSRDEWSSGSSDWSTGSSKNRDRMSSRDDWGREGSSGTGRYDRESVGGSQDRMGSSRDRGVNGRYDYMESQDYDSDTMPRYNNNFRSSTQQPRRMKREKLSGHRSQYNPNASQRTGGDSYRNNERNSSENGTSKDDSTQACALHCFLEELEMTGENGMPDRYLVSQVMTKDVKNEDLRDFLQESTEECFQILYNEHSQDKCEFSKNLMMCLSEKGRANCDDWKDDLKF